jgi:hypothetical protein
MITVEFKGYVKFPEVKSTRGGKEYSAYAVRAKQGKKPDGSADYVLMRCKEMDHKGHERGALPPENAFVTVKGSLNQYEYEKDGVKRSGSEVFVHSIEVAPPKESAGSDFPFEDSPF